MLIPRLLLLVQMLLELLVSPRLRVDDVAAAYAKMDTDQMLAADAVDIYADGIENRMRQ
jgi:hypothetical protein